MRRTLIACALLFAAPAAAQPSIEPGRTVTGELSAGDPVMKDGIHYDVWRFSGLAGHVYLVTLRSARFDAMLSVGTDVREDCVGCHMDDDAAGGTDAGLRWVPPSDGTYEIRASSYGAGETGAYALALRDEGVPVAIAAPPPVPIHDGDTVQGRLERGDATEYNRSYTDTYLYDGRAGETLVVTLRSADFDAVVAMGRPNHGGCRPIDSDDDGAGGTDSRLVLTLSHDGPFHVHVRTAQLDGQGAYTLTVERQ